MHASRGIAFVPVLLVIALIIALGGGAYIALHQGASVTEEKGIATTTTHVLTAPGDHPEVDHDAMDGVPKEAVISWKFIDMDFDANNTPHTEVTSVVNGKQYVVGTFAGTCKEIDAAGGADGKGLLAGELSAVQCMWGDDGSEIGVFAHEDGGYQIMAGTLSTGEGKYPFSRGNFKVKADISR